MAVDTALKRFSLIGWDGVEAPLYPPTGTVAADERATLLRLYSGIPLTDVIPEPEPEPDPSGGGVRGRILPPRPAKKKKRKTLSLRKKDGKVVEIADAQQAIDKLAESGDLPEGLEGIHFADILQFTPREGEAKDGEPLSREAVSDAVQLALGPYFQTIDAKVSALNEKVDATRSHEDQLLILARLEQEKARKEQLVALLMQLVVLLS